MCPNRAAPSRKCLESSGVGGQQGGTPVPSLTPLCSATRRAEALFPGSKSSLPRRRAVGPNQVSPPGGGHLYRGIRNSSTQKMCLPLLLFISSVITNSCTLSHTWGSNPIPCFSVAWMVQLWPSRAGSGGSWSPLDASPYF